jgi:hypothetical protein
VPRRIHGTVLGLPTFGELADLVAVQRFNLAQLDSVRSCPAWAAKDPVGYGAWAASVYDATAAMNAVLTLAQGEMDLVPAGLRNVTPVAVASPFTKSIWDQVLDAAQPFHALVATFVKESGCAWPSGSPPQPTAPDFDLKVYQWTGKALQAVQFGGSVGLILLALAAAYMIGRK